MEITVIERTNETEQALKQLQDILTYIPESIIMELSQKGLKISLVPNIFDYCPTIRELSDAEVQEFDKNCPSLYAPLEKTIYIAEKWKGYERLSLMHNLLNRYGYAHGRLTESADSSEFSNAILEDLHAAPANLQEEYKLLAKNSFEIYAVLFDLAITVKSKRAENDDWFRNFEAIFPRSLEFVRQAAELC